MEKSKRVKMVIFDMDGVLVPIHSSWAYIHEKLGVHEKAREYLEMYERGEIDYIEWMRLDTGLWVEATEGKITVWQLERILREVPVRKEAVEVGRWLRKRGIIYGIISGGIDLLAKRVSHEIGADFFLANQLSYDKRGRLIPGGKPIVGVKKHYAVKRVAGEYGIPLENVMFVGDSRWDKEAMAIVGYPVIYGDCEHSDLLNVAKCRITSLRELPDLIMHIEAHGDCGKWCLRGRTEKFNRKPN
jgi:phosphoserine phosphatase